MNQFINSLDSIFSKAPKLPTNFKDSLVKVLPYLLMIGMAFNAISILGSFSASALFFAGGFHTNFVIVTLASIIVLVMHFLALPGLYKRALGSWQLLFYALCITTISLVLTYNILSAIVTAVVGAYFLFQIRSYYSGSPAVPMPQ